MQTESRKYAATGLAVVLCLSSLSFAQGRGQSQPRTRRTQRVVPMKEVQVASPDAKVTFRLGSNPERLTWAVTLENTTVIEPSALDVRVDGYDLSSGVVFNGLESYQIDETYPWHGAHSTAVNRCHGVKISLTHDLSQMAYVLEIRAFNDGVAYRHIIPPTAQRSFGPGADAVRVPNEYSTFLLPAGTTVWYHDLDGHYEAEYDRQDISDVKPGQWAGPPVTFQLPDNAGYGSITEANLVNYSGMALEYDGRRGWVVGLGHRQPVNYPYELRYGREEAKRLAQPASVTGVITTPWRVVLVARDLNTLVNSDILPNLCPPADPKYFPQGMKTPWVEPGLCVWDYVDRNYVPRGDASQFDRMKDFSRMAGLIGAKYHILEGFAYGWTDDQIHEFAEYSQQQGVRVLFWRHSNQLRTPEAREEFFTRLHRLGVAGAKIDFFDHEAKENIDLYEELLKKAAEYRCVLDFHGANKPTGRLRTWPNAMLYEGVRGMESSGLKQRARHETILPFARYLAGPCDYTTMIFTDRRRDSTWAHQIACLATFHSPILTIAAHPQSVLDNPALEVIKSIPAVWDETIVLPESKIGDLSLFARRRGDMWMLAVMSAGPARTIRVPLSFLGEGSYQASLVRDSKEKADAVVLERTTLRPGDTLTIDLAEGGGFVARFTKTARDGKMKWFREAKFGLFIHWGLYAIPAGTWKGQQIPGIGEWIMNRAKIPVREYEQLAGRFNPVKFNAEEWVRLAEDAGMKYIVITSKHHDGFAMYGSKVSKYNIVDATPFQRDVLKELADACAKRGMRFGFYYSQAQDWHEPGGAGNTWDFPPDAEKDQSGAYGQYLRTKAEPQVKELLTRYGPVCLIWFDTPRMMTAERGQRFIDLVHTLQPACLIDGRLGSAGDYRSMGDNRIPNEVVHEDWEVPATLNDTWGYKSYDNNWKTPEDLTFKLVDIVSKGGNYLLNVGPTAEGVIPQPSQDHLRAVGRWLQVNGEAIYGAGPTPFGTELGAPVPGKKDSKGNPAFNVKRDWRCTTKPGKLYIHLFTWPAGSFELPPIPERVARAYLLADPQKKALAVTQNGPKWSIALPEAAPDKLDSVLVVETM